MHRLTQKMERFCQFYVQHLNGAKAAREAGYTAKGASQQAYILLRKPEIKKRIGEIQDEYKERLQVNTQTVIEELARLGLANARDYVNGDGTVKRLVDLTPEQAAAVKKVTTRTNKDGTVVTSIELADKRAALVDVGRHLGIFERDNEQAGQAMARELKAGANIETARLLAYALAAADREQGTMSRTEAQARHNEPDGNGVSH